ncbi:MAG: alpha/beta hydrolase [Betaproteobacteria bacterium]
MNRGPTPSSLLRRLLLAAALVPPLPLMAQEAATSTGIVILHGKGGMPQGLVRPLAEGLEARGWQVANLQMPWSRDRQYDVDVEAAVKEVDAAVAALRGKGSQRVLVAGHSQGGVFALHYATLRPLDGLVAIAPGGNVANSLFLQQLGGAVSNARRMVSEGRGQERGEFLDYEGARGSWTLRTTAATYLSWFDPEGAMNQFRSLRAVQPATPVLLIVPQRDYPALLRIKDNVFRALPANPRSRLVEPETDHPGAPRAAVEHILRWAAETGTP